MSSKTLAAYFRRLGVSLSICRILSKNSLGFLCVFLPFVCARGSSLPRIAVDYKAVKFLPRKQRQFI